MLSNEQRRRLEQEKNHLEEVRKTQNEKLVKLKIACIIENDESLKFKYEKEIKDLEIALKKLDDRLDEIEKQLEFVQIQVDQVYEDKLSIAERISQFISGNANVKPHVFLRKLGELIYNINHKKYDVMIFNLDIPFKEGLRDIQFYATVKYENSTSAPILYCIWIFKGGEFTNQGDDTAENWFFRGNTSQQDRIVRFISSSWTCICQNGRNVGSVDIWWGDTAGDGAWACNEWRKSLCNGGCTAQQIMEVRQ